MKISVITITFNSALTLEQTVRSVLSQSYPDIEYIIVDACSTDNTPDIINKYRDKIHQYISEKDNGLYDAMNKGIEIATGEVIAFLHSDDFYMGPHVVSMYADIFKKNNADAVYSDLYYVDKNNTDKIIRKWKSGAYRSGAFLEGWMPPHPTFFVKKEIFKRYGKFDTSFKSASDYELMLRFIHRYKINIFYLPEFTIRMRVGGKSNVSLQNRLKANIEDRLAWKKNGLKPRFYTLYLKPLRKVIQYFRK